MADDEGPSLGGRLGRYARVGASVGGLAARLAGERYLDMLAAGGTKHHAELLKPFGLDARDPAFWQGGLGVIGGMIDEIERLDARS